MSLKRILITLIVCLLGVSEAVHVEGFRNDECQGYHGGSNSVKVKPHKYHKGHDTFKGAHGCVDLPHNANSFHIGSDGHKGQIPKKYKLLGFTGKGCVGSYALNIHGKSDFGNCYQSWATVGSIILVNKSVGE